jgi:Dolichyl-phosphate-mannose-protein mannosyltransferase
MIGKSLQECIVAQARKSVRIWLWMIPLLLVFTWAGVRSLNTNPIWYDEWYSLYYAGAEPFYGPLTLAQTVERTLQYNEYNPPGYYILLNVWGHVVGWTPFALRALSLLFAVAAVAVVYGLGNDLGGKAAGIGAAVALGGSAFFINQSHEIRMYTLFPLLVSLTLWAYWRMIAARQTRISALILFVSLTGLFYTHYMALPLLTSLALFHLLFVPKNRRWFTVSLIVGLSGLLFLPWLQVAWQALGVVSAEGARNFFANSPLSLLNNVLTQFSNGSVALLVIFGWYSLRHRSRSTLLIVVLTLGTFALVILLNQRFQFISIARYLSAVWPLLALVVGLGVAHMQRDHLRPAVLLGVWVLAGAGLILPRALIPEINDPGWQVFLPWPKLASELQRNTYGNSTDPDILVDLLPAPTPYWFHAPLAAYYLHHLNPFVASMPEWLPIQQASQPQLRVHLIESPVTKSGQAFRDEAVSILGDANRVWLVHSPADLPSPFARPEWGQSLVEKGYAACEPLLAESDLQMSLYTRVLSEQLPLQFGSGIRLGLLKSRVNLQDADLSLLLGWSLQDMPPNMLSVGLHIDDRSGTLVAQTDYGVPASPVACIQSHISIAGLPNGAYTLHAILYNWQSGERLNGKAADGSEGERLELLRFALP